jgi:hypothetical protein
MRITMSVPPPGGNGTITRIGREGQFCAFAGGVFSAMSAMAHAPAA